MDTRAVSSLAKPSLREIRMPHVPTREGGETLRFRLVAPLVAAGLLCAASVAAAMTVPKLQGTIGPGFTISLKASGKTVKMLKAGKYTFVVTDKASIHNFTLDGPGLQDKTITGTGFTGTKTATLSLKSGTYKYYCTIHPSINGKFKVT